MAFFGIQPGGMQQSQQVDVPTVNWANTPPPAPQQGVMQTQQIPYNGPTNSPVMGSLTNANGGMNWGNLLGDIGTGAGLYAQGSAQSRSASTAQGYANATSQLNPFNATTSGGMGASMHGGSPNLNYGPFNSAYGSLAGVAGSSAGTAGSIQTPSNLSGSLNSAFGSAAGGLGGFTPGAAGYAGNNAFLGAGNAAGMAGQSQDAMMQQYLRSINALQAPQIQHQTDQLQGTLFGNGQTGSSSGGYLAQQFGQGLASQNTQNSLAAQQLGMQGQQTYANVAGQLGGLGQNLLSSAFGNFGQIAGLPSSLQGQYLQNSNMGIQGGGAITNQGLGLYNAGLQTSLGQNQASARAGALSTQNANSPNQQSPFGQLASGFFGSQGGQGSLSSLFNQGKQLYNGYNSLFGGGGGAALDAGMMPGGGGAGMLSDMFGGGAAGTGSVLAGGADMGSIGSAGAGGMFDYSGMLGGDTGFSAASGGAAATADASGVGTAGVGGGALGAPGYGADMAGGEMGTMTGAAAAGAGAGLSAMTAGDIAAGAGGLSDAAIAGSLSSSAAMPAADAAFGAAAGSSGAGSGAALGAGAGAGAALGAVALPFILNSLVHTGMGASYWSNLSDGVTKNAPPGNPDQTKEGWFNSTPALTAWHNSPAYNQWSQARDEILNQVVRGTGANGDMPYTQQQLLSFGITPQLIEQTRNPSWTGKESAFGPGAGTVVGGSTGGVGMRGTNRV